MKSICLFFLFAAMPLAFAEVKHEKAHSIFGCGGYSLLTPELSAHQLAEISTLPVGTQIIKMLSLIGERLTKITQVPEYRQAHDLLQAYSDIIRRRQTAFNQRSWGKLIQSKEQREAAKDRHSKRQARLIEAIDHRRPILRPVAQLFTNQKSILEVLTLKEQAAFRETLVMAIRSFLRRHGDLFEPFHHLHFKDSPRLIRVARDLATKKQDVKTIQFTVRWFHEPLKLPSPWEVPWEEMTFIIDTRTGDLSRAIL